MSTHRWFAAGVSILAKFGPFPKSYIGKEISFCRILASPTQKSDAKFKAFKAAAVWGSAKVTTLAP